jgi:uncharacterized protein YecE (DUF72 family)
LRLGTSSWSSLDWKGPFYPPTARPADFLGIYARYFDAVECDATFYATPATATVDRWVERTPESFLMASKLPREISHQRGLLNCRETLLDHLNVMRRLGGRLSPLVAQFPYFARGKGEHEHRTGDEFRARLSTFLEICPTEFQIVVEVRNAGWIAAPLLDLLRSRNVGLVLPVYYTMPSAEQLFADPELEPVTSDLIYVRFLGHHREMDQLVERLIASGERSGEWSETAVDRREEMGAWAKPLRERAAAGKTVMTFFNNHYAGYAPDSIFDFARIWQGEA